MLPRFEEVHRARPVALVTRPRRTGFRAPFVAVEASLDVPEVAGRVGLVLRGPGVELTGWYDGRATGLSVVRDGSRPVRARSRRHGRPDVPPQGVGLALTGRHLAVLTRDGAAWTVRGRVEVGDLTDDQLSGLEATVEWRPRMPGPPSPVRQWRSGTFGRLGLRDVAVVSHADGRPVEEADGRVLLTATHAGPGFADSAHTGVWAFDPATYALEHRASLWFRRDGVVRGDHATHLVRDGDRWLVATSTWGDFDGTAVGLTLASSTDDLTRGEHVVEGRPVELPVAAVGAWDPHLAVVDGRWHLAFVAARRFFDFHPVLTRCTVAGELPESPEWELVGSAPERTATEGVTLVRFDDGWRLVASDGPDSPPGLARRFPVFDLSLRETGVLDAPYPSNIPWPTLLRHDDRWLLVTFDGTPYGGPLPGYGTHGDLIVLAGRR